MTERPTPRVHLDPPTFVEAVRFTAAKTGFDARLVEKDYFCTLVLDQLAGAGALVFKGGTCLAKVHAGFYRLSEDLGFVIATAIGATRGQRRSTIAPVKAVLDELPRRQPALRVVEPLAGANVSTQYLATVTYASVITRRDETIKIEVALREPLLVQPVRGSAASILLDPLGGEPLVEPVPVRCIALIEAFAEKLRAALSRREPAIRDFFDVDWAVQRSLLAPDDPALASLLRSKLAVPGNSAVNVSAGRLAALRQQVELGLRQVLRPSEFAAFDLDRAFRIVSDVAAKLVELAASLDEEQRRAASEGLSEDELALFDLLFRDSVSKADREKLKQASRTLLTSLTALLAPMPAWTQNVQTQAQVKVFILDTLWLNLPRPPFTDDDTNSLIERIYDFVLQRSVSGQPLESITA